MINKIFNRNNLLFLFVLAVSFYSCEDFQKYELPEAGSIEDATPPTAGFNYSQDEDEYQKYTFGNTSVSATDYAWDFGDGGSATGLEPEHYFPGEGTYTVTLTASDALGQTSTVSQTIEVIEPEVPVAKVPEILENSFEDGALDGGTGDGRDSWRCSFGTIMQITSGPVNTGLQAAKFPAISANDDRVAYQELEVSANTDYRINFFYTTKTDQDARVVFRVMNGPQDALPANDDNVLGDFIGTDNTDANIYVPASVEFNTGATETIAILITNEGAESRLDDISIEVVE